MQRILLVDDDSNTLLSISKILNYKGYHVETASDGAEALDYVSSNPIDLLITDMQMPIKDGLAVIQELRNSGSDFGIIAISGGGDVNGHSMLSIAMDLGADASLEKPIHGSSLLETVRTVLAQKRAEVSIG